MVSSDKIWDIIQNKKVIPGTWRHWKSFSTSFSDEPVFIVINEVLWYAVRIIVFDKPQRWGKGNLQVFKVSEHLTLNGAKEKADELANKLKNVDLHWAFPVFGFLNDKKISEYWTNKIDVEVGSVLYNGIWGYDFDLSVNEADDYLRPFDYIVVNRGIFKHVGIYLGKGYVCHFSGNKVGSSGSGGLKIKKDTLKDFFQGEARKHIQIVRPVVDFKSRERLIRDITSSIHNEYGQGNYEIAANNCEHFATLILFGVRTSPQMEGLEAFTSTSSPFNLKDEIRAGDEWLSRLTHPSEEFKKIEEFTKNDNKESYGDWESRIEVSDRKLNSEWCKLM